MKRSARGKHTMATTMTQSVPQGNKMTGEERKVILASSVGTVFEWYDFYIYGTLATILAKQFFSGVEPQAAFVFTLLAFAAGFAVRPFGALVFGHIGDLVGRKYTFIITITCMGTVSYTHLRAHETGRNLVCRLLLA